jgi:hypothetical protein
VSWTDLRLVEVRKHKGELGIFAKVDLDAGVIIGVFDGTACVFEVDEQGVVDWRGQDGGMSIHLKLTEGKLFTIMPTPGMPPSGVDFINHSCKANCRADPGVLVVETIMPVKAGEQLTLNYHDMDLIKLGRPCWCTGVREEDRCIL